MDNFTVTQRILLELLLEKSTAHLILSVVDKLNSRLQVRKSPSASGNKPNQYTKCSMSNWHMPCMRYEKWVERKSRYCIVH